MTIGEVAVRSGLATSAIRYYEKTGLLAAPARANGRRVYQPEILPQLLIIRFGKETGFTLSEIRRLLRGFPTSTAISVRWKKLAQAKIIELESSVAKAKAMMKMLQTVMLCRCQKLEECARVLITHQGKHSSRALLQDKRRITGW